MMTVQFTCKECKSGVEVYPSLGADKIKCQVCQLEQPVHFNADHLNSIVKECPCCSRQDFYKQKDFNRKIGVALFVLAAIASIWTYGISFIVLFLLDVFLFKRLASVVICYNCQTIFRGVKNIAKIADFNHEMNDRIVYSGHDFKGRVLDH